AARDREDGAAEDLGRVGAEDDAEREDAGGKAVDLDVMPGKARERDRAAEIEQQDDDELGDAADNRRVGVGEEAQGTPASQLRARSHEADKRAENEADRRDQEGHLGAGDELPAIALEVEYCSSPPR